MLIQVSSLLGQCHRLSWYQHHQHDQNHHIKTHRLTDIMGHPILILYDVIFFNLL